MVIHQITQRTDTELDKPSRPLNGVVHSAAACNPSLDVHQLGVSNANHHSVRVVLPCKVTGRVCTQAHTRLAPCMLKFNTIQF